MPRHCSAGGCKSRDNRGTRNTGLTFHKLPKGATRRKLWISHSHRADSWAPQTNFVYFCSKHFTPESFELTGCSGIRRLKEDAFPTVFQSSSTVKCKRSGRRKRQDIPVSETPSPGQQETDTGQPVEEEAAAARVQRSGATVPEETDEKTEPLGAEQPSPSPPAPPPEPRPLSPSRYMRRLPPPPGSYLAKEHSYAQYCPLLWRRRYDQAIAGLEKALRQLHAARRRENRLRSHLLKLRDKQVNKQAQLGPQDGCSNKNTKGKGPGYALEESETEAETALAMEDRCVDQMVFQQGKVMSCFNCGVEQVARSRASKAGRDTVNTENSRNIPRRLETSTSGTVERNAKDTQRVNFLERAPGKSVETGASDETNSQALLQTQALQHWINTAGVSLLNSHKEHSVKLIGAQQQKKLMLSDMCEAEETDASGQGQQLFYMQTDSAEGQLVLVPVPATHHASQGMAQAQAILLSDIEQHPVINNNPAPQTREDVREKLKEHLEGFHLQLSTEFSN